VRALLAEDNPMNRALIRDFLTRLGYEVAMAEHGAEAVDLARTQDFDIILLDIQMPVMDGLEAATRIRRHQESEGGPRAPILALTAYAGRHEIPAGWIGAFDQVLPKPLDLAELERTLRQVIPDRCPGHLAPRPPGSPLSGRPDSQVLPPQLRRGFLRDTPDRLDKAREFLALGELGPLQGLAHYLVNSALAVKALDMAGMARSLEAACLEHDAARARECMEALEAAVRKVASRFQAESDQDF
jgi:CheY-like chemotaxis protein